MVKYLDSLGLTYLWAKIKNYVSNYVKIANGKIIVGGNELTPLTLHLDISGKQDVIDSSNKVSADYILDGQTNKVFTATEKTKLDNIASGAEVNLNAFSNIKIGNVIVEADGKTDTLEIVGGGDVTVTPDVNNDKVTISVSTPKNTSQLTNDSGFITGADIPEGAAASTTVPKMDGTAAVGTEMAFARGDHLHPSDTTKADKATTLAGYGITDASIVNGVITLGNRTLTPLTNFVESDPTVPAWAKAANKPSYTAAEVGAASSSTTINGHSLSSNVTIDKSDLSLENVTNDAQVKRSEMGVANGVATLDSGGKVPSSQLPSYVDDVVEVYARTGQTALSSTWLSDESASGAAIAPETGKIYVLLADTTEYNANTQFRWGGTAYVKLADGGISAITNAEIDAIVAN